MRKIEIEPDKAGHGLMALLVALAEVLHEALCHQAVRRIQAGRLSAAEVDRVGVALREMEVAIEALKREHGLDETVEESHRQLARAARILLGHAGGTSA